MDPAQLAQMIQMLRGNAMAGAQAYQPPSPGGLLDNPSAGYARPGAPAATGAPPAAGLLWDPAHGGAPPALAAGAPQGFPAPSLPPTSIMPMDRLRAMGAIGGQPFGMRVNPQLPALPPWLTMGKSPTDQMAQILNVGKGPMLGQQPAAPAAAAPAKGKLPATVEDFIAQYGGNSRNQGSAGDNAGHPDRSGGGSMYGNSGAGGVGYNNSGSYGGPPGLGAGPSVF